MSTLNEHFASVTGNEALTVGERITSFFKELSLGIDSFSAKKLNGSIHQVSGGEVWKQLAAQNNYFGVSIKHIPAPVFFDARKLTFANYVEFVLRAIPLIKAVDEQADQIYRGLKTTAATGKIPLSVFRNAGVDEFTEDTVKMFDDNVVNTGVYTRALNELYPNFSSATKVFEEFNRTVRDLSYREPEVLAKRANAVIDVAGLLKRKIDSSDVTINAGDMEIINNGVNTLVRNVTMVGKMMALLSDLTRVLELQAVEAKKL